MGDIMNIFNVKENRIKCGDCNSEFDFNQNQEGCPMCALRERKKQNSLVPMINSSAITISKNYLSMPINIKLPLETTKSVATSSIGAWGMFNSFFPGKTLLRILAHLLIENKSNSISLKELVSKATEIIKKNNLNQFRGFPNHPDQENSISRLVYHFIKPFSEMGLFIVKSKDGSLGEIWGESWNNIEISLSKEGFEFAKLKNNLLDENERVQILTSEERQWLIHYLQKIDRMGYKEYSILSEVFSFIKQGHNGKEDLWNWFSNYNIFRNSVKEWSRKSDDKEAFNKQLENLSSTFAASKIALLREMGVIKNKRNDYTLVGEL
jgi:hypothetical protein